MKAAYYEEFGGLDQIKTDEIDKPEPGEGEVLVRIKSAGVNPVDAAVARGMLNDFIPAEFPVIPGWDLAGVVEDQGHAVKRFKEGEEVFAYARRPIIQHGTFAEYIALPESYLAHRPEKISMEEAGGMPLVGLTAYQSLFDAGDLQDGQTVLILGASGGVGTMAIQMAKKAGATIIGVASQKNHTYMKELGADETIDYNENHVGESVSEIEPDGIDFIFHCSRGDSLSQSIQTLKPGGKLVSITKRQPEISDDIQFQYVFVEPDATQLESIREMADDGNLTLPVSEKYKLEDAGKALKKVESLHSRGKRIITP